MSGRRTMGSDDDVVGGEAEASSEREEEALSAMSQQLDHFSEVREVHQLLTQLATESEIDALTPPTLLADKLQDIFERYQEQPHLLDSHLDSITQKLTQIVSVEYNDELKELHDAAFRLIYILTKVRGYKVVSKRFQHSTSELFLIIDRLNHPYCQDPAAWHARYVLLLWLSLVAMLPFDIHVFEQKDRPPLAKTIVGLCKTHLVAPDISHEAAAQVAAQFLTRPDQVSTSLPGFFEWCYECLASLTDEVTISAQLRVSGALAALAAIYKIGKREDLISHAPATLSALSSSNCHSHQSTQIRKFGAKLVQRVGLVFLAPRLCPWRYQRGKRALMKGEVTASHTDQDALGDQEALGLPQDVEASDEDDEGYDIPEETEEVLDFLLTGLKDKDTVVRWSCAKGIGRITGRLPKELADDVVESLQELFQYQESDGSWHGGCLALAELARRGLLLPARLDVVVPTVTQALQYDVLRGSCSIGSHVRDAACYVAWAFARAYDASIMGTHADVVAAHLVVTTVFDREPSVRRAASAALQELVGRLGTIPHGIDLITIADYFSVGNRSHAYLKLAVHVCHLPFYQELLITHLCQVKLVHWDTQIRELAARCLSLLAPIAPHLVLRELSTTLADRCVALDLNTRHGALMGVGAAVYGLSQSHIEDYEIVQKHDFNAIEPQTVDKSVPQCIETLLETVLSSYETSGFLKGMGGSYMKNALCVMFKYLAKGKYVPNSSGKRGETLKQWLEFTVATSETGDTALRSRAVKATVELAAAFCAKPASEEPEQAHAAGLYQHVMASMMLRLDGHLPCAARCALVEMLGRTPLPLIATAAPQVFSSLIAAAKVPDLPSECLAEARASAIEALADLTAACIEDKEVVIEPRFEDILNTLLQGLDDYTIDSRGDVGSQVRVAGIRGLNTMIQPFLTAHAFACAASDPPSQIQRSMTVSMCDQVVCALLKQGMEKIDRVRDAAATTLCQLLPLMQSRRKQIVESPSYSQSQQDVDFDALCGLLLNLPKDIVWSAPHTSFPVLIQTLTMSTYSQHVLTGLIVSVGGLTESLVRASGSATINFIMQLSVEQVAEVLEQCITVLRQNQTQDILIIPLLKTINLLAENACLDDVANMVDETISTRLIDCIKVEITKCTSVLKLVQSARVLTDLLYFPAAHTRVLSMLMVMLCHRYPRVRRVVSEHLYVTLLGLPSTLMSASTVEQANLILANTEWDGDVEQAREYRNQLCQVLGVAAPKSKAKPKTSTSSSAQARGASGANDLASYRDLVERAGY
eukprot:m.65120 g.65120  ORF g.65120 m.65120 type:complete len:1273 (-) comp12047_c0_seq2:165-3983(-)